MSLVSSRWRRAVFGHRAAIVNNDEIAFGTVCEIVELLNRAEMCDDALFITYVHFRPLDTVNMEPGPEANWFLHSYYGGTGLTSEWFDACAETVRPWQIDTKNGAPPERHRTSLRKVELASFFSDERIACVGRESLTGSGGCELLSAR
ncbi:MAG: hypothetical protein ACYCOU_02895 [Sulfobacillus sp.]